MRHGVCREDQHRPPARDGFASPQVREAVEAGEYFSSSEVIREALRDWNQKRALRKSGIDELRRVWKQALEDSSPGVSPHDVFERLERKYQAIADASGEGEPCA